MTDLDTHFLTLVPEYRALICKVCRLYARNDEDRKDLHQEILVQVWRALPGFRREAAAGTWLYRVALNTAISFYRKQRTRAKILAEDPAAPDTWHAACPTPSDDLVTRERLDRLYAAIARLSNVEKAVVMLYLDDCSYAEIAAVTGLSPSNVGVRLHRAKKKLATLLAEVSV